MRSNNISPFAIFGLGMLLATKSLLAQESDDPVSTVLRKLVDTLPSAESQGPESGQNQSQASALRLARPTTSRLLTLTNNDCVLLLSTSGEKVPELKELPGPLRIVEETFALAVKFCTVQMNHESDDTKRICSEVEGFVSGGVPLSADQEAIYLKCLDGPEGVLVRGDDVPSGLPGV